MDLQHDLPRGTGAVHPHCRCCGVSAIRAPFVPCEPPQPQLPLVLYWKQYCPTCRDITSHEDGACVSCATDAAKPQAVRPAKAGA